MQRHPGIRYVLIILLIISLSSYGLLQTINQPEDQIFLATTTSVQNTGLLDYLIKEFEKISDIQVRYTAVGSGNAIQLARDGEVDATLTHAPDLEQDLIDTGIASSRHSLWYNYFVIIGPESDPANMSSTISVQEAMIRISQAGDTGTSHFYSRGDQSGTHLKELKLWENITISPDPQSSWYYETGTGMSATMITTDYDPIGHTLTDIGTFATLQEGDTPLDKKILFDQDEQLYNPYSYMIINQEAVQQDLNIQGAMAFLQFLQLPSTQQLVENYRKNNTQLFYPL